MNAAPAHIEFGFILAEKSWCALVDSPADLGTWPPRHLPPCSQRTFTGSKRAEGAAGSFLKSGWWHQPPKGLEEMVPRTRLGASAAGDIWVIHQGIDSRKFGHLAAGEKCSLGRLPGGKGILVET